jgi:hypothetical protein
VNGTRAISAVFQTISSDLLDSLFHFTQCPEKAHLFFSVPLADLGHCKSDMNQNPVTDLRHIVFEKAQLNFAPNASDFYDAHMILAVN